MRRVFLYIVFVSLFCTQGFSQNFNRIENLIGLDILAENNGAAVADYDGDLDLDIFVVAKSKDSELDFFSQSKLLRNNSNGTFTDVTVDAGISDLLLSHESNFDGADSDGFKNGVSWGDYDNDGYPDLFFTHSYKVQLFHNEGDGTFIETTTSAGIVSVNNCLNTGATWFDANNDGFLDIYLMDWAGCGSNTLYINNGDGTFVDRTQDFFGANPEKPSFMAIPFDFNSDGFMDLYVSQDLDESNDVFINNNGMSFSNEALNYGLNNAEDDMGMTIGDYNNDGYFDIFIATIRENPLFKNNGDNTFSDVSVENDVEDTGWAWGPVFADFDLDGDQDLFVTNGYKLDIPIEQQNVYFENLYAQGEDRFQKASDAKGFIDQATSVTPVAFDYDNDGDLDLLVTNSDKSAHFYENETIDVGKTNTQNWLKVALRGTTSNRDAIGASVSVITTNKQFHRHNSIITHFSQSLKPLHFGLADETQINEITIKWPSGLVETHTNFDTNQSLLFVEGSGYQNYNIPTVNKISGCIDPQSCNYNPLATISDDSCEYLTTFEINGDSEVSALSTVSYSYAGGSDSSEYKWIVEGGEIINGHGTKNITVRWHVVNTGKIIVQEFNNSCFSQSSEIDVTISIKNAISENYSVARIWNEALLHAIRRDFARPTVHARNLFHTSIALYDAWAIYDEKARTYLLGNTVNGFTSNFNEEDFQLNEPLEDARAKTISYAAYRILSHRFKDSPGIESTQNLLDFIMNEFGYDTTNESLVFSDGDAAALGNFIARAIINYGNTDGSREATEYDNAFYSPVNAPLFPITPSNPNITDPNRWQPLSFIQFIDQSGNLIQGSTPDFLSPEWGNVKAFALTDDYKTSYNRDGTTYNVYHDPMAPPYLNLTNNDSSSENYKWGFTMVATWASHLDPSDNILWDISPKSIGNIDVSDMPTDFEDYSLFYDYLIGGDIGRGHQINPFTNTPYEEQLVPRGDYARVLAEFWADGPDSETPPGHWFTILNYVSDQVTLEKKLSGAGAVLDDLEWDVKSYFLLGGAMHDAAISAWSVKGWYDYIRPISAIRYMAQLGQSTDMSLSNYHIAGIPLVEGYIEIVNEGDPLAGVINEHVGKIKLYSWRGHRYINNVDTDAAGVGWILAENWWPYQRPSFVTPPFAGYVSGHSTYSRAAAEVMTLLTGDAYFPGGVGEFVARKNEFLVFEEGPSVDVKLQWATYRDASDQCSLSRIWGGIHPPADDIPGRLIGEKIGIDAFNFGVEYFNGKNSKDVGTSDYVIYPNPITSDETLSISNTLGTDIIQLVDMKGSIVKIENRQYNEETKTTSLVMSKKLSAGVYVLRINNESRLIVKH